MLKVWVISDGSYRAIQALEVAKRLEENPVVFQAKSLMPANFPDVVIGAGEGAAELVMSVKKASGRKCYAVIILDPRKNHAEFDLIIMPGYEPVPEFPNVIKTTGLINHINKNILAQALQDFAAQDRYGFRELDLRPPYLTLLIGGKHVGGNITGEDAENLAALANEWAEKNDGSVLVSTCKRTEQTVSEVIKNNLKAPNYFYEYNGAREKPNPYVLFLALSDTILVTGDSLRMCSEAASAGKKLFIYDSPNASFRYKKLHTELFAKGYALPHQLLQKQGLLKTTEKFLDEAGKIAEYIKSRL